MKKLPQSLFTKEGQYGLKEYDIVPLYKGPALSGDEGGAEGDLGLQIKMKYKK
ncbi:MAG: hypothetical protein ABR886_03220 [Dehalococcoidales bacterium]|jgi:hypothetical protein